jgi:hypothetical protein
MSIKAKIQALVDSGLAESPKEAREMLIDMGEIAS